MGNIPKVFYEAVKKQNHNDPTTFFKFKNSIKKHSLKSTIYSVLYRKPTLQNIVLDNKNKEIEFHLIFKAKIESKLLNITNEELFFYFKKFFFATNLWCRGVALITTAQLPLTESELRFCESLNPV